MVHASLRPIAVVLIAVGLLQGCGGSSRALPRVGAGGTPAPSASGPTAFPSANLNGTVALPAGVNVQLSSLTVVNSIGTAPLGANGAFTLLMYSDGPQLTAVIDKNGSTLLIGFLSPSSTTLDVNSTAAALLFFATASFALTSDLRDEMMTLVPSAPGISGLASAIGGALAANPDAFATSNPAVATALQSMVSSLLQTSSAARTAAGRRINAVLTAGRGSASTRRAQSVLINPLQPASGLTPISDFPNGVHFQNTLRRPADLYIDRVSFVDAQGNTQAARLSLTPSAPINIPPTVGVSTTVATLVDIVQGKYAYAPITTASTALPLVANAQSTLYQLTTVGPGLNEGALGQVTAEEQQDQEDLSVEFLLKDMALPLLLEFAVPGHDIDHALGTTGSDFVIHDLVHAAEAVPGVAQAAQNGEWGQALKLLLDQVNTSQSAFALAVQTALDGILQNQGILAQQQAFKVASAFMNAVRTTDQILTAFDASVMEAGLTQSDEADIWTVTVVADQVTLTPQTATVANGTTQTFTANVPSQSGSGTTLVWTWANTATSGHLTDGIAGHLDNFNSSNNAVTYTANPTGSGTDTITVTAFLVQGQNRVQVGSPVTATITVSAGLVAATHGPVTVPAPADFNGVVDAVILSFDNPPNGPVSTTNPDALFEVVFQPNTPSGSPPYSGSLAATFFVLGTGGVTVSGTPLAAVTFQVTGSPPLLNTQATMTFQFYIQQAVQVPANHEFTCSFFQGATLLGSGLGTVNIGPGIAPNGAELACIARFIGAQNQGGGTTIANGFALNTTYTLVISQ
jgi:hypothetical protein